MQAGSSVRLERFLDTKRSMVRVIPAYHYLVEILRSRTSPLGFDVSIKADNLETGGLIKQYRQGEAILVARLRLTDFRLRLLKLGLAEFYDRSQAELVAGLC